MLLLKPRDEAFAILLEITDISWEAALNPDLTTGNIVFPFEKNNTKIMPLVVSLIYIFFWVYLLRKLI